jgi:hypothetical protein
LPVPLILAFCFTSPWSSSSGGVGHSPVLSPEERRHLQTFEKPCQQREDCESPLGCLDLYTGGPRFCVASECLTDSQCRDGFTCRQLASLEDGPLVRRCVLVGTQREGQSCLPNSDTREQACEWGLLCHHGFCGRPCEVGAPGSCPEGFACGQGPGGPSCRPHCRDGRCPPGEECIHQEREFPRCAVVRGANCERALCPDGQRCFVTYGHGATGAWVEMECVVPCGGASPACEEGFVCDVGACRRRCAPGSEDPCGPGEKCGYIPTEDAWLCFQKYH